MWLRGVRFGRGWEGTLDTPLGPLGMECTDYGATTIAAGASPTPRLAKALDQRASEVIANLVPFVDRAAAGLADLWNEHWRGKAATIAAPRLRAELRVKLLCFNGGVKTAQYMLFFEPMKRFEGLTPHLTVTRGEPDKLVLESALDESGAALFPYDATKQHFSLRKAPAVPASATPKRVATPRGQSPATKKTLLIDRRKVATTIHGKDADALAARFLADLPAVLEAAGARLATLHEASWSELDRPALDAAGVLRKVKLARIALDGKSFALTFRDGGLFGGHAVIVTGSGRRVTAVDLAG